MFSKIIKSPITGFVIGIGGIIFGVVFYLFVERKEIQPRYAVSEPETLAEATADAPGLTLLWEDEEIENVHTINIVIWNAGRQYLDKNSISTTDPIRVTYPSGVQILHTKFIRPSRESLEFTATDLADAGISAIQIEMVGDEALEHKDGGLLKILFSGPSTKRFAVTGRIKGSREGFIKVDWHDISHKIPGEDWLFFLMVGGAVLGTPFLVSESIKMTRKAWRGKKIWASVGYGALLLLFVYTAIVCAWILYAWFTGPILARLPWLP